YQNSIGFWYLRANNAWAAPTTADPRSPPIWFNSAIPSQMGSLTFEFDATPFETGAVGENSAIGLSPAAAAVYTDLAAIVAFQPNGTINVINGAAYGNDVAITYTAGTRYHVEMDINIPNHTYSVYVTPKGGVRTAIATNYAFRSSQATASTLTNF